jgi:hypothetical protein
VSHRYAILVLVAALSSLLVTAESARTNGGSRDPASISNHALSQLLSTLPADLPIYGIYVYPLYDGSTEIAMLTAGDKDGWQIRIYGYDRTGQFASNWQSSPLASEFAVSSASHFRRVGADGLHEGTDIEFNGCKAHDCPGSFGVLLYSPFRKRAFQAVVRNGEIILSPELDRPQNKPLKDYLLKRVKEMSHYQD